ncbi:MAG: mycothiol synthase [Phycicoccus sp.]|nr:mycothiol synthase [Phycicoccus sp.]NMM33413.1 mycothiol synthase [Phycicoccus sp.]
MQVRNVNRLDTEQLSALAALIEAATQVDDVAPLSEQVLLDARDGLPGWITTTPPAHFLAYDGTHLAGYAHLEREPAGTTTAAQTTGRVATAEVVVDPRYRRHGIGTALFRALEDALQEGTLQIWSHGHLGVARFFAAREEAASVRTLWTMRRSLGADAQPLPTFELPQEFRTRHFVVGQDEDAWLQVNERAFVHHPEQGQMTRVNLDRRIAESWFDATGFILIEDIRGPVPVLAASHWTKVVPPRDPQAIPTEGEVYVVAVDPAYHGMGLGQMVTVLGLGYLAERGLSEAFLFVEGDNTRAISVYSQLGFTRTGMDVMYSRYVQPPVRR